MSVATKPRRSRNGSVIGPGPWCGTVGGYSNHDCRCEACRAAWSDYMRLYIAERKAADPEFAEAERRRKAEYNARRTARARAARAKERAA